MKTCFALEARARIRRVARKLESLASEGPSWHFTPTYMHSNHNSNHGGPLHIRGDQPKRWVPTCSSSLRREAASKHRSPHVHVGYRLDRPARKAVKTAIMAAYSHIIRSPLKLWMSPAACRCVVRLPQRFLAHGVHVEHHQRARQAAQ